MWPVAAQTTSLALRNVRNAPFAQNDTGRHMAGKCLLSVDTRLAVSTANDGVQNGRLRHEVNDLFHQK